MLSRRVAVVIATISVIALHGNVSPGDLPAGTYRLDVEPDTARAISGTFDVR
jgi:hypothetical protein